MHSTPVLLLLGAATVGVIHSILPDHWVPLALVARTQRWSLMRLTKVSGLAATGHALASMALGGVVALFGLQFQKQIETQQGHVVGAVLIVTGLGFLAWGLSGHGHPHDHDSHDDAHRLGLDAKRLGSTASRQRLDDEAHRHRHKSSVLTATADSHIHEHEHQGVRHSHRHRHEAFIQARAGMLAERSSRPTPAGRLTAIAVPFGVATSPDLTFLPFALAAAAYGKAAIVGVLGVFAAVTILTFVGLTVIATAVGYQMRGEWLERNANTIASLVLVGIGMVAFFGL